MQVKTTFVLRFFALLLVLFARPAVASNYTIYGDTTTTLNFSITPPSGQSVIACYQMVGKPASATWTVNGSTALSGTVTLGTGGTGATVVTNGIGITPPTGSTSQYIEISYGSTPTSCGAWTDFNHFLVDPILSVSPNSVTLGSPSTSSTANATVSLSLPAATGLTITGSCTGINGPTFSSSNSSMTASSGCCGHAAFPTITANNLVVVTQLVPSATCTFTAGGTHTTTLSFEALGVDPKFGFNPNTINTSGTTPLAVVASSQTWPTISVNASCTWPNAPAGSSIVVAPASALFSNSGLASFTINTTKLVYIDRNINDPLSQPTCTFQVPGGTHPANLPVVTGNACNPALGLMPLPPGC